MLPEWFETAYKEYGTDFTSARRQKNLVTSYSQAIFYLSGVFRCNMFASYTFMFSILIHF